jgi:hypothetical protein
MEVRVQFYRCAVKQEMFTVGQTSRLPKMTGKMPVPPRRRYYSCDGTLVLGAGRHRSPVSERLLNLPF